MTEDLIQFTVSAVLVVLVLQFFFWLAGKFRGLKGAAALTSGIKFLGFGSMIRGVLVIIILGGVLGFIVANSA